MAWNYRRQGLCHAQEDYHTYFGLTTRLCYEYDVKLRAKVDSHGKQPVEILLAQLDHRLISWLYHCMPMPQDLQSSI